MRGEKMGSANGSVTTSGPDTTNNPEVKQHGESD